MALMPAARRPSSSSPPRQRPQRRSPNMSSGAMCAVRPSGCYANPGRVAAAARRGLAPLAAAEGDETLGPVGGERRDADESVVDDHALEAGRFALDVDML